MRKRDRERDDCKPTDIHKCPGFGFYSAFIISCFQNFPVVLKSIGTYGNGEVYGERRNSTAAAEVREIPA